MNKAFEDQVIKDFKDYSMDKVVWMPAPDLLGYEASSFPQVSKQCGTGKQVQFGTARI